MEEIIPNKQVNKSFQENRCLRHLIIIPTSCLTLTLLITNTSFYNSVVPGHLLFHYFFSQFLNEY